MIVLLFMLVLALGQGHPASADPALPPSTPCTASDPSSCCDGLDFQACYTAMKALEDTVKDPTGPLDRLVAESCNAGSGIGVEDVNFYTLPTNPPIEIIELNATGYGSGRCPVDINGEGAADCLLFLTVAGIPSLDSSSQGNGECYTAVTSPVQAFQGDVITVDAYAYGEVGVIPGHSKKVGVVYCAPSAPCEKSEIGT